MSDITNTPQPQPRVPQPDLAIARLLAVVEKAVAANSNDPVRNAMRIILGLGNAELPTVMIAVVRVLELVDAAELEIRSVETIEDVELYLDPLEAVRKAFAFEHFGATWAQTGHPLLAEPSVVKLLRVGVDQCRRNLKRPAMASDDTIRELLDRLNQLEGQIMEDGDLDVELRAFLLERTAVMREALKRYNLFGMRDFEASMERMLGALAIRSKGSNGFWDMPAIKRTREFVALAANTLQIVQIAGLLVASNPPQIGPGQD